ncbi:mycofactocin-associated electron transfer flavoprotein beta subunit [Pseudofrankia inefficax]|uniref:Electron transfer flavoprotein alpha/beta-subunit n=1 Tax=Pseudofrankia inefficax (strain DSM 45817 / CECT 9037 / DDB 130130 / EuI1c) TaxID=298654 RepID=E3IY73_PSEI1|nr:mycofactocin-associated electron transfer flavoprotein beta subunit [Pseudofrankia inefficax]ADP82671.1 Electron transfer flavoprotein alpha/beta-subunit [Pseudofrankia inefficax]
MSVHTNGPSPVTPASSSPAPRAAQPAPDDTPLVAVCLRVADLRPRVDPLTGALTQSAHGVGLSAADEAALERALTIAEAWSGRVLALAAGPPIVDGPLRAASALGAQPLRVAWPPADPAAHGGPGHGHDIPDQRDPEPFGPASQYLADVAGDTRALAVALVDAIRTVGEPALVLCGDHSPDRGTGALPAQLADALGAAQALGLVDLRVEPQQVGEPRQAGERRLLGERRLDGGRRERLRIPTPAVCSAEAAGVRLRRASLPALLATGDAPIPAVEPAGDADLAGAVRVESVRAYRPRTRVVPPPAGATPRDRLLALTGALVAHEPPMIVGPASAAEAADALLAYLTRAGYLTS